MSWQQPRRPPGSGSLRWVRGRGWRASYPHETTGKRVEYRVPRGSRSEKRRVDYEAAATVLDGRLTELAELILAGRIVVKNTRRPQIRPSSGEVAAPVTAVDCLRIVAKSGAVPLLIPWPDDMVWSTDARWLLEHLVTRHVFPWMSRDSLYFVECTGTKIVKVGRSIDVDKRLAALRSSTPADLRLLGAFKNLGCIERAVHSVLDNARMRGEWFAPTKKVRRVLRACIDVTKGAGLGPASQEKGATV